jgi:Anti-sigma-K factor rskA
MSTITKDEFRGLVGAYVLGALDGQEIADVEGFIASHAFDEEAERLLAAAFDAAASLVDALPEETLPVRGAERVMASVDAAQVRKLPVRRASRARQVERFAFAAAFVCVVGYAAMRERRLSREVEAQALTLAAQSEAMRREQTSCAELLRRREDALEILHHHATQLVRLEQKTDAAPEHVRAIFNPVAKKAWIVAPHLHAPVGKDFELWVVSGKDVVAAGVLRSDAEGVLVAEVDPALLQRSTDAFVVTLETEGGVAKSAGQLLLVGSTQKI